MPWGGGAVAVCWGCRMLPRLAPPGQDSIGQDRRHRTRRTTTRLRQWLRVEKAPPLRDWSEGLSDFRRAGPPPGSVRRTWCPFAMPSQAEMNRTLVAVALLEEIRHTGKAPKKQQSIAVAHGLAFDPHVDGRLRLTPIGRARVDLPAR